MGTSRTTGMRPSIMHIPAEMNGDQRTIALTIPAKAEFITLGRLALTGLARVHDFPDETLGDLKLALTEACSNSVRHAYDNGEGCVEIVYELHADRLVVEVSDSGRGFGPDPSMGTGPELDEGGLGIAIIRAVTDEFELGAREGGQGSRLRFVKFLSG
jgi:serine/threonine-protein kinase RsbW